MLWRVASWIGVSCVAAHLSLAGDKDHLQRGEPELKYGYNVKYDTAVRQILSRGWDSDVVLRTVALPPFNPEAVLGLLRNDGHYRAFVVRPSTQIWEASGMGSNEPYPKNRLGAVRLLFHSRPISDSLAARIAALYRHVLADRRNYSKDENIYLDTTQTILYLAFAPNEHITANMIGWGPHTEQVLWVNEALMGYAAGKQSEAQLSREVTKRERKLGI
jgi:hypothetical protein